MRRPEVELEPVRLSVRVPRPVAEAFEIFTRRTSEWWPHDRQTFRAGFASESIIEPRVGGRFYERYVDGSEFTIGLVTLWQPPHAVGFTWKHPDWPESTDVVVRFSPEGADSTLVELEHRGFERLAEGRDWRERYANGWPAVMDAYEGALSARKVDG